MKCIKLVIGLSIAFAALSVPGCGGDGTTVIQPTEAFQPTEAQKKAEEEDQRAREAIR